MVTRTLHCRAWGADGRWEAICLDFDLAVQGSSWEEVRSSLDQAIQLHLEASDALPAADRLRMLRRRSPFRLWVAFWIGWWVANRKASYHHQYTMPLPAAS